MVSRRGGGRINLSRGSVGSGVGGEGWLVCVMDSERSSKTGEVKEGQVWERLAVTPGSPLQALVKHHGAARNRRGRQPDPGAASGQRAGTVPAPRAADTHRGTAPRASL